MYMCGSEFFCRSFKEPRMQHPIRRPAVSFLGALGFAERIRGDHHIFSKPGVAEMLNLQPRGSLAKPYQVKQVRSVIIRYNWRKG
jgi:hypothetical protein